MIVSDYVALFLQSKKIDVVFEMSGGMIANFLDAISRQGKTKIVSMHHEQAAGFAAEGYARISGKPGVALATSGPGATNLLTAIGSCYFDSTPSIFITGQVNRSEQKAGRAIRQLGFQETDIVSMAKPITKLARMILMPEEIPLALEEAYQVACSGRPGPVLLDIPMDVQRASTGRDQVLPSEPHTSQPNPLTQEFLTRMFSDLQSSERPLILIGGGIRSSQTANQLLKVLERLSIPVVHSLMGVDVLHASHPLRVGMIGTYGNRWANISLAKSDFLLVLGSRLDIRQTGSDTHSFRSGKQLFHVDCEQGELNNRVVGCTTLVEGMTQFFKSIEDALETCKINTSVWLSEINALRSEWPDTAENAILNCINPNKFMRSLSAATQNALSFVVDVGQHQMWAAQSLQLARNQRFITSGGMGAMGFALPTAIGAITAWPDKPAIVIAGDGGFQTNIQELQTVRRNNLPLKIVILNNRCHGMVRQFQESYFEGRYQSTLWGYDAPDFEKVAIAYGIPSRTCARPDEVGSSIEWLVSQPTEPSLLQVMVDTYTNAYPKTAFGRPISEMEPFAKPIEMEGT